MYNSLMQLKKVAFLLLVFVAVLSLLVGLGSQISTRWFGIADKGGLRVISQPVATLLVNDQQVGLTPYIDEHLNTGDYLLKIASGSAVWQSRVKVNKGTLTVVNRELSENIASAAGEVLTLTPGSGVVITANPEGSEVVIDGKLAGRTPLSVSSLAVGEHTFQLNHEGYRRRDIKAMVPEGLTLNLMVDLPLSDVDLSTTVAPPVRVNQQLVVKSTPTGFLRVRDKPSLEGKEITRVNPGDTLVLVEELGSWDKIRLKDGREGFVSSQYVSKKP